MQGFFSLGASAALLLANAGTAAHAAPPASSASVPSAPATAPATLPVAVPSPPPAPAILPSGTPLTLMLNAELNTKANKIGDTFDVTVLDDVVQGDTVVIPKGAIGHGEVTFLADKGGFGRAGMIMISLRMLDLGARKFSLDGRFREEGRNNNGAAAATGFAVGVLFSGLIKGKSLTIPKGRELKARTGEDIAFTPGEPPPAVPAVQPAAEPAANPATQTN